MSYGYFLGYQDGKLAASVPHEGIAELIGAVSIIVVALATAAAVGLLAGLGSNSLFGVFGLELKAVSVVLGVVGALLGAYAGPFIVHRIALFLTESRLGFWGGTVAFACLGAWSGYYSDPPTGIRILVTKRFLGTAICSQ